ncbi:unannotated protein [freshwater metagenome]|uniref:Unannotated protein n=1 Tax=freshwater metagenome TaxID=449393 RepID=A0A6J7G7F1_9ZZZZ
MNAQHRQVADREVMPIGFGAMRLGLEGRPSADEAVRTLHAAFDAGIQLIDTAVNYCATPAEFGYDEALVSRALREWSGDREEISVVCKGGVLRTATEQVLLNGSPENLRWSCETSLRSLGVDKIWMYLLHGVDPKVPFEESVGALVELQREGKVQHIGLSNVGRKQFIAAQELMTIASVQNGLSLWNRASLPLAQLCAESGHRFPCLWPAWLTQSGSDEPGHSSYRLAPRPLTCTGSSGLGSGPNELDDPDPWRAPGLLGSR